MTPSDVQTLPVVTHTEDAEETGQGNSRQPDDMDILEKQACTHAIM
jgi:hypothetical protein